MYMTWIDFSGGKPFSRAPTCVTVVWFGTGALRNAIELCRGLANCSRDTSDDGWVEKEE